MWLRLNQYASARLPSSLCCPRNQLNAYRPPPTTDQAAWLALIRQHWFEDTRLRNEYFEYLSSTHRLEAELEAIRPALPVAAAPSWSDVAKRNPAAVTEFAAAEVWRSDFENTGPALESLAEIYSANPELNRTASSVIR